MKFKIKTLDHRDFSVNFSDLKTVSELKAHICRIRGAWLHPENQRIFYAGRVLDDEKQLCVFCIDERKFLLMLPKKAQSCKQPKQGSSSSTNGEPTEPTVVEPAAPANTRPMYIPSKMIKEHIMKLGPWKEPEVRRALLISLNNPKRAIDYLIAGKAPFPKMVSPPPSRLFLTTSKKANHDDISSLIPQSPKLQTEYDSGCDFEEYPSHEQLTSKDKLVTPKNSKSKNALKARDSLQDIQRLAQIGFPREIITESYRACNRKIKQAAVLLFEKYVDEFD